MVVAEHAAADAHGRSDGVTYLAMFGIGAAGASLAGTVLTHPTSTVLFGLLSTVAVVGRGFG